MISTKEFVRKIQDRDISIAIWGCGFVGTTNMLYLAKAGFRIVGIESNPVRVNELNRNIYNINCDLAELKNLTNDQKENIHIESFYDGNDVCEIHMLCLPTEKDFKPYNGYLTDVIEQIAQNVQYRILLIIECSMTPKWIDTCIIDIMSKYGKEIGIDYLLGAAPRRDLFGNPNFTLSKTKRVIGGDSRKTLSILKHFYSSFCSELVPANDCYSAVFSKVVENTYRCFCIGLANQLNHAFPNYDVSHILELASTKWNVDKYHPSFGIGSYCIPLAPIYILEEVSSQDELEIFNFFIHHNNMTTEKTLSKYTMLFNHESKIVVLGISSIENVAIFNCSIGINLANLLIDKGYVNVFVHDFYYTLNFNDVYRLNKIDLTELKEIDVVFLITPHDKYKEIEPRRWLKKECIVIDSFGIWKNKGIKNYYEVGRPVMQNV